MEKILIGGIVGIFIGAFTVEILSRKSPQTVKKIEAQAARVADRIKSGLQERREEAREPLPEPSR